MALRIIAQRHPFFQGTKRTAWLHTVGMLHRHILPESVSQDAIITLVTAVAVGELNDIPYIAARLRDIWSIED